jgi:hypothetical protein
MNEIRHSNHGNEGPEHEHVRHEPRPPYWKRAHQDWRVWVAVVFCMIAITIYVLSDDLALLPRHQLPPPQPGAAAR